MEDKKLLPKLIVSIILTFLTVLLYFYNSTLKISLFQGQRQESNKILTLIFWILFCLLIISIIYLVFYFIIKRKKEITIRKAFVDVFDFLNIIPWFFLIALLINSFICAPAVVQGQSMEPTFNDSGNYVLITRSKKNYNRGDIIVIDVGNMFLIKRLIALPGDSIEIDYSGNVYVNDELITEDYINDEDYYREAYSKRVLGEDEYFYLGDNRNVSEDARRKGPCSKTQIVGKVFFRFLPLNKMQSF